MKINKKLNLVIPVERDDGSEMFVHSTPIQTEIFKQYYLLAFQTMNALYTKGVGLFAPRAACEMLRETARENAGADGQSQMRELARAERFIAEIRRMSNVMVLGKNSWEMITLDDAKSTGLIDEDECDEIDGALVFFTCAQRAHRKADQNQVFGALSLWSARTELLSCTDFLTSLPILTATGNSGAKVAGSSRTLSNG